MKPLNGCHCSFDVRSGLTGSPQSAADHRWPEEETQDCSRVLDAATPAAEDTGSKHTIKPTTPSHCACNYHESALTLTSVLLKVLFVHLTLA